MHTIQPHQNTGVRITPPNDTDLHVGGNDFSLPSILNSAADWREFECDGEWQKDMAIDFESEACMSFAAENAVSTYLNWLLSTGQLPATHVQFLEDNGYIGSDGKVSCSGRFTAKMSGTTQDGNDFQSPWKSMQTDGLVPDSVWPMPAAELNADPGKAWEIYYAQPTPEVIALGKAFITFFEIDWRWLVSNGNGASALSFKTWLTVAPVHIATVVCDPWNTAAPINGCGCGAAHGTLLTRVEPGVVNNILDHYAPFDKQLAAGYCLSYAAQGVVRVKALPEAAPVAQVAQQALTQAQEALATLQSTPSPYHAGILSIVAQLLKEVVAMVGIAPPQG